VSPTVEAGRLLTLKHGLGTNVLVKMTLGQHRQWRSRYDVDQLLGPDAT
jgi:hypothetical protein